MLFLSTPVAIIWITGFFLATAFGGIYTQGWEQLSGLLPPAGGYVFFGTFGAALRQADAARRRSDRLLAELQEAHRQLQEYASQAQQLAVAKERNRLARDMHDALGHRLTVAVVQLEGAQRLIPTDPERAARMVGTMRDQLKEALAELRQAVAALRATSPAPAAGDPGPSLEPFDDTVAALAHTFQVATGLPVYLALPADFPPLPLAHRLALYRAVQESLTNIQRHAAASQAWLEIQLDNGTILLTVADDGQGLPPETPDGRFGLQGLRERAGQLGGQMILEPRPGGGTQLRFQLPLPEEILDPTPIQNLKSKI